MPVLAHFLSRLPLASCSTRQACRSAALLARMSAFLALAAVAGVIPVAHGYGDLNHIGLTPLRAAAPELTGAGMTVAQVEASILRHGNRFEPSCMATGQPCSKFTFINRLGKVISIQKISAESEHATRVGRLFYGVKGGSLATGVCPAVSHIDVWDAQALYRQLYHSNPSLIPSGQQTAPAVVNQSYVFDHASVAEMEALDSVFDDYAARHNTLFISAIGNGLAMTTATSRPSQVNPPADAYNGIAVAAFKGCTGIGPAWDGRSKPDISAPGRETSYAAPLVSGAATLLLQAGKEGLGGATSAATDIRVIKALLLNGAVKPAGWTNSYTIYANTYTFNTPTDFAVTPLDPRYGSGVLNVYNAYRNLLDGEHSATIATNVDIGVTPKAYPHAAASEPLEGWSLGFSNTRAGSNRLHHYVFDLAGSEATSWNLTATLDWNVTWAGSSLLMNHFDLDLIDSSGQVAWSESLIDNVQQIHVTGLAPGTYDLVVMEMGAAAPIARSRYAVAWNFSPVHTLPDSTANQRHR